MASRHIIVSRSRSGGYDYDFVEDVPELLICHICTKPLRDPHLTVCCGHHYCESCLDQWFKRCNKESCPHCRAEGSKFQHVINKEKRSEIIQKKVRCTNSKKGCEWVGELASLDGHLQSETGCGYVILECPNGCKLKSAELKDYLESLGRTCFKRQARSVIELSRKDLSRHLKSECIKRPYQCEHCRFKNTYMSVLMHYPKCPEFPLECPNKCGEKNIKRKTMEDHRRKCPQEVIQCPFSEAGCVHSVQRRDVDDHVTTSVQHHLSLVMRDYKRTKQELRQTKMELKDTNNTLERVLSVLEKIGTVNVEEEEEEMENIEDIWS